MEQKIEADVKDRISETPELIKEHILSFLPIKEVVKTSILSKTWNSVWTTFPILEFDETFVRSDLRLEYVSCRATKKERQAMLRKRHMFINIVEQTLLSRHQQRISIKKFAFYVPFSDYNFVPIIDRWIGYVTECNVKELNLNFGLLNEREYVSPKIVLFVRQYLLPKTLLVSNAKSITSLKLVGCKLEYPKPHCEIKYSCLKELLLRDVNVDDQSIQNLISTCPGIEDLTFCNCHGFKRLQVSGFDKLKKVTVDKDSNSELERVEIEALNLLYLKYGGSCVPCEIHFTACKNLKTMAICMAPITDNWFHDHLSKLPLLETLFLSGCHMLESIKISSSYLRILHLHCCRKLVKVEIDAPYLCSFSYSSSGDIITSFSLNALALLKAEVEVSPSVIDSLWYIKLTEFLGKLSHAKELILGCNSYKDVVVPKECGESLIPPLYNVKHLKLKIREAFMTHEIVELADGLLWMCPHPDTLSIASFCQSVCDSISIKFLYEKLMDGREISCRCISLPIKCWRHSLKEVRIENFREAEYEWNLKRFFLEKAKILEKINDLIVYDLRNAEATCSTSQ